MSNALYSKGRQAFLEGKINWLTDTIRCQLVDTAAYTPNLATHQFLSDIAAGARIGTPKDLVGQTTTDGVADANDVTFPTLSGPSVELVVLYKWTGVETTSPLIAAIDTATGLPVTPSGGDIIVSWDNGSFKIFRL